MAPRRKGAKDTKAAPRKGAHGQDPTGGGMLRFLFVLSLVVGIGYAASSIPVAGKTVVQHVTGLFAAPTTAAAKKGTAKAGTVAAKGESKGGAKNDGKADKSASSAPAKGAAVATSGDHRPADRFSRSEKDAVNNLLR